MHTHTIIVQEVRRWLPRIALILALLVLPLVAEAQQPGTTPPGGFEAALATGIGYAITLLNLLTWIVFVFLVYVMDPDFIFATNPANSSNPGALLATLNGIWQISRDTMNVIFAFGLIFAAIVVVVTADKERVAGPLKSAVVAIILVNFSWFIPRVIFDISNVVAATIYSLPESVANNQCIYRSSRNENPALCTAIAGPQQSSSQQQVFECECSMVVDAEFMLADQAAVTALENTGFECPLGTILCLKYAPLDSSQTSGFAGVLNGLVVNHARLRNLAFTVNPGTGSNSVGQLVRFIISEMIILVLHVALFFPLLAMLAAFIMRIPVLWLTIAFMPAYFLGYILPDGVAGNLKEQTKKILTYFIKAAFLPAIVAVPLAIGFIMINVGSRTLGTTTGGPSFPLIGGVNDFYQLIWMILTFGVIWTGVFSALKSVEFVASVTEKIRQQGSALGKVALKAPLSFPVIPGLGNITPLGALRSVNPENINAQLDLANQPQSFFGNQNPQQQASQAATVLNNNQNNLQNRFNTALTDLNGNFEDLRRILRDDLNYTDQQIQSNAQLARTLESLRLQAAAGNLEGVTPQNLTAAINRLNTPPPADN